MNASNVTNSEYKRLTVTKKKWCQPKTEIDAEDFYKNEIEELMYKIRIEEEKQSSENVGICFVVLRDGELAQKMLDTTWLSSMIRSRVKVADIKALGIDSFIIHKAYLESDIIWNNLKRSQFFALIKRTFLFLFLGIFSLILLTPAYALELLKPI